MLSEGEMRFMLIYRAFVFEALLSIVEPFSVGFDCLRESFSSPSSFPASSSIV